MAVTFGPYSTWRRAGDLVVISGQLGVVPSDQPTMIEGGAPEQLGQALVNARAVLAEAGATFDQVIKATLFLTDMSDFAALRTSSHRAQHVRPLRCTSCPSARSPKSNSGPTRRSIRRCTRSASCRTCNPRSAPSELSARAPHPTWREVVARAHRPCAHRRSTRSPTRD